MKRVLISGYYGMQNTGDDALMAVTAWGTKQFLKANQIYATTTKMPELKIFENIKPIYTQRQRFKGENRLRGYYNAVCSHQIIFGGGSVFHTDKNMKQKINLLKLSGKRDHVAIGVALGPFKNTKAERVCAELLKRLSFIGLRDQVSLDIARSIAPDVRAEKTFDLAPLLPRTLGLSIDSLNSAGVRKGIGLALCNYESFTGGDEKLEEARKNKIIQVLKKIGPDDSEEIVFIDFNGHPYYNDRKLHLEVAKGIGKHLEIRHIPYSNNPLKVLKAVAGLRTIIAMRLHAAVFGYIAQTPTIILSYHPKCLGWASETGMPPELVFDSHDFDIGQLVRAIKTAINGNLPLPTLPIKEAEKRAMKNWVWTNGSC